MKSILKSSLLILVFFAISCGGEDCMECTGTNNSGEENDFTICDNGDGTTTRTNNLLSTMVTDSVGYAEGVAFFESAGLDCQ